MMFERVPDPLLEHASQALGPSRCGAYKLSAREYSGASQAFADLERAVYGVMENGWEDSRRRIACALSSALLEATRKAGWEAASGVLGSLTALLTLPIENVLFVRGQIGNQMLNLLGRLTQVTRETSY